MFCSLSYELQIIRLHLRMVMTNLLTMHIFCLFQLEQIEINLTILLRLNSFDQKRKQKVCQKKWKTTQDDLGSCRDPVTSACTTTTITTSLTRPS